MTPHPYRYECPEGHTGTSLEVGRSSFMCRACGHSYDKKDLVDKLEPEVNVA